METEGRPAPGIPVSAYRLQFNRAFTFSDAAKIIPYLNDLGVTDIYSSPYFRTGKGSLHGYDVVDHGSLNPEVGIEEDYLGMTEELRRLGMGQILDIVPNHMCICCPDNSWWMDMLENGQSSPYSGYFDINWDPVKKELKDKVLLPVLADQYGKVLEQGDLTVVFEEGAFFLRYMELKFPLIPATYVNILKHRPHGRDAAAEEADENFTELLSIMTSLEHLPPVTEQDTAKIAERYREKEVAKKRLADLCVRSGAIRSLIEDNVRAFNGVKGDPGSFDLLDELLGMQTYRLSFWSVAADEINYRRFFDLNHLAAIRMEKPAVFRDTHRLVLKLVRDGRVTGLRIDHLDGLYDPIEYCRQLQRECLAQLQPPEKSETPTEVLPQPSTGNPSFYVVGEKILTKGERLSAELQLFGTTGYNYLNALNGIFVDTANAPAFDRIYRDFTGQREPFQDIAYGKKKLMMEVSMSGEVNTLAHHISRIAEKDRHTRDFTLNSLREAIIEVIAFFPVYRTYTNSYRVEERDRQFIELAVAKAKRRNPAISGSIFDFLKDVLLIRSHEDLTESGAKELLDFAMRFQQITGPVMAKGVEDTAFYVYNRLLSLNEVGGAPDRFGSTVEAFHGQNMERLKTRPNAVITTATHDTKRGEDVRARINVLSEIPEEWKRRLSLWSRLNRKKRETAGGRVVPDRNEEYFFYQILIGIWPAERIEETAYSDLQKRLTDYMTKALREAKVNTSWIDPDAEYEEAMTRFIRNLLDRERGSRFLEDFEIFRKRIACAGMVNSLSQTLLKITSPGVPDFYQGAELWDLTLVDPDNRRPVDFEKRTGILEELRRRESETGPLGLSQELLAGWENGYVKLFLIYKALNLRRDNRELFEKGEYIPLQATGPMAGNVCAFARRMGGRTAVTVVPRLVSKLFSETGWHQGWNSAWEGSAVEVPFCAEGDRFRNILTSEIVEAGNEPGISSLSLRELFSGMPFALLEKMNG